ncbi:hypothetical protein [Streptomyces cyaneofuscatus]|uniref:hypothetical protein n=1 Tax=Streptomyces cyaneofuscatus TaxID=66883 RepID=UPI0036EE6372
MTAALSLFISIRASRERVGRLQAEDVIERVRAIGYKPDCMDPNNPPSQDYLLGYRHAMDGVKRAVDNPPAEPKPTPDPSV